MLAKIKQLYFLGVAGALATFPLLGSAQNNLNISNNSAWDAGKINARNVGLPGGALYQIISSTLAWLLAIFGFIAIIGFVVSGVLYLTAAGNEKQIEQAKNAMTYSIIGVIVALMGYVIVQAVDTWLGGSDSAF